MTVEQKVVLNSKGDGLVSFVDVRDIAEVAASLFGRQLPIEAALLLSAESRRAAGSPGREATTEAGTRCGQPLRSGRPTG